MRAKINPVFIHVNELKAIILSYFLLRAHALYLQNGNITEMLRCLNYLHFCFIAKVQHDKVKVASLFYAFCGRWVNKQIC